jgi:hypothetical protein
LYTTALHWDRIILRPELILVYVSKSLKSKVADADY